MKLVFTKMQGLGNDFIVFDGVNQDVKLNQETIKKMCDRHYGIGADQILIVENPRSIEEDFFYRIFNSDGSEVAQCGNGVRCLALFIGQNRLSEKSLLRIATDKVTMEVSLKSSDEITVNMGHPVFLLNQALMIEDQSYHFTFVDVGNPHAVIEVDDVVCAPVNSLGRLISEHSHFPNRANVEFMQRVESNQIKLRVYERGAGETLACGSGACAAAVAGIARKVLTSPVQVDLTGGQLVIHWKEGEPLWMTGPASIVFQGEIEVSTPFEKLSTTVGKSPN